MANSVDKGLFENVLFDVEGEKYSRELALVDVFLLSQHHWRATSHECLGT